jgi:hypothetical protein
VDESLVAPYTDRHRHRGGSNQRRETMKLRSLFKFGRGIIAVAFASLAPIGVAHADFYVLGNVVSEPAAGSTAPIMDRSQYDKLDILGNVQWVPNSRGAQGPLRSDSLDQASAHRSEYRQIDILGNVFWRPETGTGS